MPVMGPDLNPQTVEDAYNDVLLLLKEKYGVQKREPSKMFAMSREKTNAYLREAVREVLFQEECENF